MMCILYVSDIKPPSGGFLLKGRKLLLFYCALLWALFNYCKNYCKITFRPKMKNPGGLKRRSGIAY